jgi:hypothetical protein
MDYTDKILEITEKDKIVGHIYKITNTVTGKCYIGQTVSHKLNKKKYRPSGYYNRYKDHISEAINNTKKNQCTYLNNAIRKYGQESFIVELIAVCEYDKMDLQEMHYIKEYNTMYPNGYNLTKGGKNFYDEKIENEQQLNEPKKRGREFGFKHKEETINKMKKYFDTIDDKVMEIKKEKMSNSVIKYFSEKRAENLANSDIHLDDNFADLIRPQMKNNKIVSYVVRYNRKKYTNISGKKYTPEDSYKILYDSLKEAYEIRKNELNKVKITEMSESKIENPQPLT